MGSQDIGRRLVGILGIVLLRTAGILGLVRRGMVVSNLELGRLGTVVSSLGLVRRGMAAIRVRGLVDHRLRLRLDLLRRHGLRRSRHGLRLRLSPLHRLVPHHRAAGVAVVRRAVVMAVEGGARRAAGGDRSRSSRFYEVNVNRGPLALRQGLPVWVGKKIYRRQYSGG
jgi:hypothetical protein